MQIAADHSGTRNVAGGLHPLVALYLLFFAVYLLSAAGHFFSTDHVAVYLTAQSLVERGSLAIKPIHNTYVGPDGQAYSVFGLGQSLLLIPFYLAGRAVEAVSSPAFIVYWSGANLGDWGGTVPIFFASLFNQFVMPLLCILVFRFGLAFGFSRPVALGTTLIFGFGTAAWVYARDSFQHPLESLLLLSAIYVLFRHREHLRPVHALMAGSAITFGILTRINLLLIAPVILGYLLLLAAKHTWQGMEHHLSVPAEVHRPSWLAGNSLRQFFDPGLLRHLLLHLMAFSAPSLLILLLILYLNQFRYGNFSTFHPFVSASGFSNPLWIGVNGYLLSPGRSLFLYSPPTVLAFYAFPRFFRQHRIEASLFGAIVLIYLFFFSAFENWHGGWSWGPRYMLPTLPFLILPLGYLLAQPRMVVGAALLTAIGIGVQILGIVVNYSYVHWDWLQMDLAPETAYLFVPEISAIPMHLQALLAGRYIDLWLYHVYRTFGLPMLLVTIAVPLLLLIRALQVLIPWSRSAGGEGRYGKPGSRSEHPIASIAGQSDRHLPGQTYLSNH